MKVTVSLIPWLAALSLPLILLACSGSPPARASQPTLDFDLLFGDGTTGRQAESLAWSPDGRHLAFRFEDPEGDGLWLMSFAADGSEASAPTAVLRPDESFKAYHWAPGSDALLIESKDGFHLLPLEAGDGEGDGLRAGESRHLVQADPDGDAATGPVEEPAFSPDGSKIAFVRDFDLHLVDVASGEVRALTEGGTEHEILNGITDWVYWEELWGRDSTGFWWSPDGSKIAYYQFDEEPVGVYTLLEYGDGPYPTVKQQKYPKAGTDNPRVRLGVLDLGSGETTWLATGDDPTEYLARLHWHPAGDRVAVQRLNRDQNQLDVLLCTVADGACSPLHTETWPTWVNLHDDFHFLPDGGFLWSSEKSGWRHLYVHGADGRELRQLTDGTAAVTHVDRVDAEGGWVVYTSYGPGPLGAAERRVQRVKLDGSKTETLADEAGWNTATPGGAGGLWVHEWSSADDPPMVAVKDATGALVAELPGTPPAFDPATLPRWQRFTIPGPDGLDLPAQQLLPAELEEGKRYPVILYHYGCPASQVVANRWGSRGRDLWHKMMAQRGYAVLSVDNGASSFFGKKGEDRAHRRFGPGNLAAQKAAVEYLGDQSWADVDNLGLWGWSGGGSNTLYAVFESPGTWKAAVAGAPVTDWRLYDTIWTERYLDHPDDNPEGYTKSSPITYAGQLEDALLVVHGTADDNVHPQNTMVLSDRLIDAGKRFEQAIHPGQKHGFRGDAMRHFMERMTEFFDRKLQAEDGPEVAQPEPAM